MKKVKSNTLVLNFFFRIFKSFLQVGFRFQYQLVSVLSGFPFTSFHLAC